MSMASSLLTTEGAVGWAASANNAISAPQLNGFRLTLTTGTPVTTSDVTSASSVYLTPYTGNRICLFDGTSNWAEYDSGEISVALSGLSSNTNYDVFVYDNAGVLTLDTPLAWSSNTVRATALTLQDGVWVKSGSTTKRYVGTFRATGTTTTADSGAKRFLFNANNRVPRRNLSNDSTFIWTYNSTTWAALNSGNAAWFREFVIGLLEIPPFAQLNILIEPAGGGSVPCVGIGLDSATPTSLSTVAQAAANVNVVATTCDVPSLVGYHYYQGSQRSSQNGVAQTFVGFQSNNVQSTFYTEVIA
jgi:hypothetical protein